MTIFRFSAFSIALLLAGCGSDAGPEAGDATALATAYCAAARAGDEEAATALMTDALQRDIQALRAFDAQWRARNPDEKPPLGNGMRLTAWQDSAGSCTPAKVSDAGATLVYVAAGDASASWTDDLLFEREPGGRLAIRDIRFDPKPGGTFRGWLADALQSPG